jgi:hypothetical protein
MNKFRQNLASQQSKKRRSTKQIEVVSLSIFQCCIHSFDMLESRFLSAVNTQMICCDDSGYVMQTVHSCCNLFCIIANVFLPCCVRVKVFGCDVDGDLLHTHFFRWMLVFKYFIVLFLFFSYLHI